MKTPPPFPGPAAAIWLTLLASFSALFFMALVASGGDEQIGTTAAAVGLAFGFGGVGTIAARAVPPPQAERLGLRGFRLGFLPPILLFLPTAILCSEIDNVAKVWLQPPDADAIQQRVAERLRLDDWLSAAETVILTVGIAPVIEEFFFRGVLQQGLVARLGALRGLALTALLFGVGHGSPELSAASWLVAASGTFLYGVAFGLLRLWSGSLLAPILLHMAVNGVGLLGIAFAEALPIPGYNAAGEHTPAFVLALSLASVGLAVWLGVRASRSEPPPAAPVRSGESAAG